jgi:AAA15 family ATPase/GTPase
MLTQIKVRNFKSFKNLTIIDFKKTNYKILNKSNVKDNIVKGGVFIGANASGKTNAIVVIRKLLELLFADAVIYMDGDECIFSSDKDMELEYEFNIDSSIIKYLIKYELNKEIMIEKLFVDGEEILNRLGAKGESSITDNSIFTDISSETLLLRDIYFNTRFRNNPTLRKWFEFLSNSIYMDAFYRKMFAPSKTKYDLKDYLDEHGVDEINKFLCEQNFSHQIEYSNKSEGHMVTFSDPKEKTVYFKRNGLREPIPYGLESLGNKNLLSFIPPFFNLIKNEGMLIIDEFSSGFHNELESLLIRYFMENSDGSQLFLVTHSTNILTNSLLRPDQIYICEFDGENGSKIKRMSDDKPREAQNLEKMYLGGVFGGLSNYED